MHNEKAHEITRDLLIALINTNKPTASHGDYITGVCNAYKQIYDTVVNVEEAKNG